MTSLQHFMDSSIEYSRSNPNDHIIDLSDFNLASISFKMGVFPDGPKEKVETTFSYLSVTDTTLWFIKFQYCKLQSIVNRLMYFAVRSQKSDQFTPGILGFS